MTLVVGLLELKGIFPCLSLGQSARLKASSVANGLY